MNLNQLKYVKAVAETKNFTQAAQRCYVTQPTLSNGIRQLEQAFENKLFKRTTRAVELTPFGEYILPFIDNIIEANNTLIHKARYFEQPVSKTLRIGVSPLIDSVWLSSVIGQFKAQHSEVEIILHEQNMADLYQMLDDGLLDFVFGVINDKNKKWQKISLYREPLYFIPNGNKPLVNEQTIAFEEIIDETFVMVPDVCGLAKATRTLFNKKDHQLNEYSGEALSYQVLEQWATLGLGAAILPKSKVNSQQKARSITDNNGDELFIEFEAVWQNNDNLSDCIQRFIHFLRKC